MSIGLRKLFILTLLMTTAAPLLTSPSHAQSIGVIITHNRTSYERAHEKFLSVLEEDNFGKTLEFLTQRPHPDPIAWSNASRKLIAAEVDAIITYGAPATLAAIKERSNIPIIYAAVEEAVANRIRARNATGMCSRLPISSLMRYLNVSMTDKKLAILYCSLEEDSISQLLESKSIAQKYGISVIPLDLRKPADISVLLSGLDASALLITSSSIISSVYQTALRMASVKNLVTASLMYQDTSDATIMLYPAPEEHGREAATMLIKHLNGLPVRDIQRQCAQDVEIIFNLKEARRLGVKIPMDLVTEATRIIY